MRVIQRFVRSVVLDHKMILKRKRKFHQSDEARDFYDHSFELPPPERSVLFMSEGKVFADVRTREEWDLAGILKIFSNISLNLGFTPQ